MTAPFERAFVINLARRPDRLRAFLARLDAAEWPADWPRPEVYPAIDGDLVGTPEEFMHGGGAYGCRMSHLRLLQDCLMQGVASVLVFEDDAELVPGVGPRLAEFVAKVPEDWEGIMPGGQHHTPPERVAGVKGVVRVKNVQRTHCYIARGNYLRALQQRWGNSQQHIDWRMKDWQHKFRVYAPAEWLVGQAGGRSDVFKGAKPPEWWNAPSGSEPVVVLDAPKAVMDALRSRGFHAGIQRDGDGVDKGLKAAYAAGNQAERQVKLAAWLRVLQGECAGGGWVVCVWHPQARPEHFRAITSAEVMAIEASTPEEALKKLPEAWRDRLEQSLAARSAPVVWLSAPRDVLEALLHRGFHGGYWRDAATGLDNGLKKLLARPQSERPAALAAWCAELLVEADRDGKVLCVWHPAPAATGLSAEALEAASGRRVVTIEATTPEEAVDAWQAA